MKEWYCKVNEAPKEGGRMPNISIPTRITLEADELEVKALEIREGWVEIEVALLRDGTKHWFWQTKLRTGDSLSLVWMGYVNA